MDEDKKGVCDFLGCMTKGLRDLQDGKDSIPIPFYLSCNVIAE
jgi:hypothetical protein